MSLDTRVFTQSPRFFGQTNSPEISLAVQPKFDIQNQNHQFVFEPFYRQDSNDHERSHFDIRQAYYAQESDDWDFLIGIGQVSWRATISHQLVNVINQTDAVEDVVTDDFRLGQPMVSFTKKHDWGNLDFLVLPGFRERTYAGEKGRIRTALPIDTDNPIYESSAEEKHIDFAGRYFYDSDSFDFGLYHFYGTGRDPDLLVNDTATRIIPFYEIINQTGTHIQYTSGNWIWGFEGLVREGQGKTFEAFVGGFNYIIPNLLGGKTTLGFISEYVFDNRDYQAGFAARNEDLFLGIWTQFNDQRNSGLSASVTVDKDSSETFFNLQGKTTLYDGVDGEFLFRMFADAEAGTDLWVAEKDDYVQFRLIKNF